jgi:hypothetical protein
MKSKRALALFLFVVFLAVVVWRSVNYRWVGTRECVEWRTR